MIQSETQIRVLYAHTDVMGVMNNVRYLEYFEAGRNTLLRDLGYPYKVMEAANIGLPVIEAHAEYKSVARYDDVVTIRAILDHVPTAKVKINYELFVDGRLIATGYTTHAFIELDTFKPRRPPADFIEIVKSKLK